MDSGLAGSQCMVDLAWIIAGIFIAAITISLVLGHLHDTMITPFG